MSTARESLTRIGPPLLLVLGLLQMTGDLSGIVALKGIGAAWGASPAPRVFSKVRGLETYSTRFYVEWSDPDGTAHSVELTPESIQGFDCVLIGTNHDSFDYDVIEENATLIVDARGVYRTSREHIYPA